MNKKRAASCGPKLLFFFSIEFLRGGVFGFAVEGVVLQTDRLKTKKQDGHR
ncbi:hypothetical protein SGRA_0998 [Saprospira grandis str. Lewin]|uniref:Uncharacterized protein n=1 Tax=Saprospira grandis (strain Lewin) TaxID=984262 RepID=H6L306_SAPGL|nr:hypothetical protein SGRA_0998 [Saprospira grandis str. Lewin]